MTRAYQTGSVSCTCAQCGKAFQSIQARIDRGQGKYCSIECLRAAKKPTRNCAQCGAAGVRAGRQFCSRKCAVGVAARKNVEELFWEKVNKTDSCWLWTASTSNGYGQFVDKRTRVHCLAHRFAYELLIGPIPEGLTLDHVKARGCTSRACVNPAHLEPVEKGVNTLRGDGPPAENARKTHCEHGHEFTEENTYVTKAGWRSCRACQAHYQRELRRAQREGTPRPAKLRKGFCKRGHELTPDNVIVGKDHRRCRACEADRQRRYREARDRKAQ